MAAVFNGLSVTREVALRDLTTFRIGGRARFFARLAEESTLPLLLEEADRHGLPALILGGGSNMLLSDAGFPGLAIRMETAGIGVLGEDDTSVRLTAAAGVEWDAFVRHCCERGWWGLENLAAIPGTVGALPIQNVGAYGQEAADVVESVDAWDRRERLRVILPRDACGFGYRRSVFNRESRGRYVILRVTFRLARRGRPNTRHTVVLRSLWPQRRGAAQRLRSALERRLARWLRLPYGLRRAPTSAEMAVLIAAIRSDGRLPDCARWGNAGSFFKNPVVPHADWAGVRNCVCMGGGPAAWAALEESAFRESEGMKLPVTRLIDAAGMAGAQVGGAALYERNSNVVINRSGQAAASDVLALLRRVREAVWNLSGIAIEPEPELVGFSTTELAEAFTLPAVPGGGIPSPGKDMEEPRACV